MESLEIQESGRKSTGRGAEILLVYRKELFMMLRDDKPTINAPLQWVVPAGVIEVGETDDEAMDRELSEEIGFIVPNLCIGRCGGYTWYVGEMTDDQAGAIRQGEGCARGFFSYSALLALAKVEGKGGVGGTILKIMKNNPAAIHALLTEGVRPDVSKLMPG